MERASLQAIGAAISRICRQPTSCRMFTLISFAEDVVEHLHAKPLTPDVAARACDILATLLCSGGTDLVSGWLGGCKALMADTPSPADNHLLLLTDGYINAGLASPGEITQRVSELRRLGITTSTCGIGNDFDQDLLQAMALLGGGRFLSAKTPAQVTAAILNIAHQHMTSVG
jgi:Ca-activated chloride channel family protein